MFEDLRDHLALGEEDNRPSVAGCALRRGSDLHRRDEVVPIAAAPHHVIEVPDVRSNDEAIALVAIVLVDRGLRPRRNPNRGGAILQLFKSMNQHDSFIWRLQPFNPSAGDNLRI